MDANEKQYIRMYTKILTDDTRWDLMTTKELEKRIAKYKADEKNQDKILSMMSCLRLAEILYLYNRLQQILQWQNIGNEARAHIS